MARRVFGTPLFTAGAHLRPSGSSTAVRTGSLGASATLFPLRLASTVELREVSEERAGGVATISGGADRWFESGTAGGLVVPRSSTIRVTAVARMTPDR